MCNYILSYMTQNMQSAAKFSGDNTLLKHQEINNGTHFRKKWGQSSGRALCARRLEGIAHPAGHRRRRRIGLKALAAMVLCLATKYGTGTDGRRGVRRQQKSKTEDVRECHYILPTTQYYYVSEQAASFCSSTTEAAAIAAARAAFAAVSTANNGLTSYQQTIQAMSEENRRRRRQPHQPLKQPRPASNWFEAVLQTCMTHKGHHHGLFFSISQHSSHSSRSSLQQEVVLLQLYNAPQDYCTATQRRPAFLVAWNDANGIYLSQYWTGWQQQGHGQLIVALQSLEFWKQRQRDGRTEATRRTSLHNGHEFPNLCNDKKKQSKIFMLDRIENSSNCSI